LVILTPIKTSTIIEYSNIIAIGLVIDTNPNSTSSSLCFVAKHNGAIYGGFLLAYDSSLV
jgi:hypothetical protein